MGKIGPLESTLRVPVEKGAPARRSQHISVTTFLMLGSRLRRIFSGAVVR